MELVPTSRYTDPAYAALEAERLWPRVWQVACTVDHVAHPGDAFELRAFQNACRHRGNALCDGMRSGLTELRCPYHRWTWDLAGNLREVPSKRWFDGIRTEELGLLPASVGTWGPLVFVSVDPHAAPLDEWLEGLPEDAKWARLDDFRCLATTRTDVECNWKVVSDGFSETYHIQGIHPEMLGSIDDVHAPQRIWDRHSVSYQRYVVPSPRLGPDVRDEDVWRSFVTSQAGRLGHEYGADAPMPAIPDGCTLRDVVAQLLRDAVAPFGGEMDDLDTEQVLGLSQYNLFPNATVLVWGEMVNVLVARPGPDPHHAELVTFLLLRHAAGAPYTQPVDVPVPVGGDLGTVLNQDVSVLASMQRGLRQPGLDHIVVGEEECRIRNLHRNLEDVCGE